MNWKTFRKKGNGGLFEVLPRNLPDRTVENNENPQESR
jgi:hypothetical protein